MSIHRPAEDGKAIAMNHPREGVKLNRVAEGHYMVEDYGLGNVGIVITGEGVVVIDSTHRVAAAEEILAELRKITDEPVKYLIYTHGHYDHIGGAQAFVDAGAEIIAHANVPVRFDKYTALKGWHARINAVQAGMGEAPNEERWSTFVYPDTVYDREYTFTLGTKTFRLVHEKGETDDATFVYVPEDKVVYVGDLILWKFPNIGNPNKALRYDHEWFEALERVRRYGPAAVVPGHGPTLFGGDAEEALDHNIEALKYLYTKSLEYINRGEDIDTIVAEVQLPKHLENSPYLEQTYGCREFTLRGIYRRYTGWWDRNPAHLNPPKREAELTELAALIGGQKPVLQRARTLLAEGSGELALSILEVALHAGGDIRPVQALRAEVLRSLALKSTNLFYRNFYLSAAEEAEAAAGK